MWLDYLKEGDLTWNAEGTEQVKVGKACYALKPDKQALVKRIFQLYIDGYGMIAISRILNEAGERTIRGRAWNVASLEGVLNNRAVIGEYQPRNGTGKSRENAGPPIPRFYPPVIEEETYYRAQKARTSRRVSGASRHPKNYNVWQGIAKCYLCGAALHLVDKGVAKYLHCYGSKKGMCKAAYLRYEVAELVFPEVLAKMNSSFSLIQDGSAELSRQIDETDARISEHQDSLRQLAEAMKGVLSPTIMSEVVRREALITDLTKKREELSLSLASEAITDKEAFIKALDLVSYEGRNRANALLKELHVTVRIDSSQLRFRVMKGNMPVLDIIKTATGFRYYAGDYELSGIIQHQERTFTPRLTNDPDYIESDESEDWDEQPAAQEPPERARKPRKRLAKG
jgi:hypothetical protein